MATTTSPITPSVLQWAVEQDGRTYAEVAAAARVEPSEVRSWAAGDAQPTVGQVTRLAEVLQRPRVFFFLPGPPAEGALPSGFRHPPGAGQLRISSTVLLEARRSKRLQQAVAATVDPADAPDLPQATLQESPAEVARRVREWLDVPLEETWSDAATASRRWRTALTERGVLVFFLGLGKDQVRGFAVTDDRAPMIVVNISSVNDAARIFTMGHELAHLVLRDSTACVEPTGGRVRVDSRLERWCEAFASALFMPAAQVRELMRQMGIGPGQAGIDAVSAMMRRFRASARAAAVSLIDLGFAQPGLYGQVLAVFKTKPRTDGQPRSPRRHVARRRQYGEQTVVGLLNTLPARDALSVLRMNVNDVRQMADEVPGVAAV